MGTVAERKALGLDGGQWYDTSWEGTPSFTKLDKSGMEVGYVAKSVDSTLDVKIGEETVAW